MRLLSCESFSSQRLCHQRPATGKWKRTACWILRFVLAVPGTRGPSWCIWMPRYLRALPFLAFGGDSSESSSVWDHGPSPRRVSGLGHTCALYKSTFQLLFFAPVSRLHDTWATQTCYGARGRLTSSYYTSYVRLALRNTDASLPLGLVNSSLDVFSFAGPCLQPAIPGQLTRGLQLRSRTSSDLCWSYGTSFSRKVSGILPLLDAWNTSTSTRKRLRSFTISCSDDSTLRRVVPTTSTLATVHAERRVRVLQD